MFAGRDVTDEDLPRAFGGYLLLQNFARGGMGDVYLAKSGRIAGLERVCVLKKLRAELTRDREYVTRFIDEARVVVTLNHANICNVFDVGRVDAEYYLAMEYVSGRDVRALQERCRKREVSPPPLAALHITCEVLEALDYAHRRHHPVTQEPLHLVHRDISPQNVLLSYEGEVKLIDFGLAASRLKVERTQPNVVMGKMAYMPPEQARGDTIDGRADLFACGVLAYELVTSERYYECMSATDIWQVAGRGGFIPRAWGSLEPVLASILARALHPDARKRFSTCGEFRDALQSYMHGCLPGNAARIVRLLMEQLFEEELACERAALARFGAVTVATVASATEQTKSQSVSFAGHAGSGQRTEENSGSDLGAMPSPTVTRSTEEGSPLPSPEPAAALVVRDAATVHEQERPLPVTTQPTTKPAADATDERAGLARPPPATLPAPDPPSLGARSRARPPSPAPATSSEASPPSAPPVRLPAGPPATSPPRKSPPRAPAGAPATSPPGAPATSPAMSPPGAPAGAPATSPPRTPAGSPPTSPPGTPAGSPPTSPPGTPAGSPPTASPRTPAGSSPTASPRTPAGSSPTASPRAVAASRPLSDDPGGTQRVPRRRAVAEDTLDDDETVRHCREEADDATARHRLDDLDLPPLRDRPRAAVVVAAAVGLVALCLVPLLVLRSGAAWAPTPTPASTAASALLSSVPPTAGAPGSAAPLAPAAGGASAALPSPPPGPAPGGLSSAPAGRRPDELPPAPTAASATAPSSSSSSALSSSAASSSSSSSSSASSSASASASASAPSSSALSSSSSSAPSPSLSSPPPPPPPAVTRRRLERLERHAPAAPCTVALLKRVRLDGEPVERVAEAIESCARAEGVR
ncbi:MAG: hypothetical protein FJ137_13450 [Deltaproteobacteria bacterium]|nr:hypothetical protein [Deltaproteobacteria bacterium]